MGDLFAGKMHQHRKTESHRRARTLPGYDLPVRHGRRVHDLTPHIAGARRIAGDILSVKDANRGKDRRRGADCAHKTARLLLMAQTFRERLARHEVRRALPSTRKDYRIPMSVKHFLQKRIGTYPDAVGGNRRWLWRKRGGDNLHTSATEYVDDSYRFNILEAVRKWHKCFFHAAYYSTVKTDKDSFFS